MKKILTALFLIFLVQNAHAQDLSDICDSKYAIIKTTHNYSPIRENADVNSKRFSHLKKDTFMFADKKEGDFYRVDLGLDKYYWIEKKYADLYSSAEKREITEIKNIEFNEDANFYYVKISVNSNPYNEIEINDKTLDFIVYDAEFKKEENFTPPKNFSVSKDEFGNLKITFTGDKILSGHEVIKSNDDLILKIKKPFNIHPKKPLSGLVAVIDPGHGGGDCGACAFNLKEKDINLQISNKLKTALEKKGAKVYMTRNDDSNPDLYERIDFAKEKNADFLISIHQNSLPDRAEVDKKHGVGVYYYNKESKKLADCVQKALIEATNFQDDNVNYRSLALTRSTSPVCILVECGYIIHPEEAKKISDPSFQDKISEGIQKGLSNYLKENYLPDGI